MQIIPLHNLASQTLTIQLDNQNCLINVYQKTTGMYFDLKISGQTIVQTRIVRDRQRLVRLAYLGFSGDIVMIDSQGKSDPRYEGLGSRFNLYYLTAEDVQHI